MANMLFLETAWEEFMDWLARDPKMIKRIDQLLQDIARGGHEGIGKPEPLKGNMSGLWSRRIDKYHRLIYRIEGENVIILSCEGHYDDK